MNNKYEYLKYKPTLAGKIAIGFAMPSVVIGVIAAFFAFSYPQALLISFIAEAIAFIGGIVITIDIVRFNISQKKERKKYEQKHKSGQQESPKELDIVRIVHMLIGIGVGIIIGYLIWGVR